jgi:hypothetical protein
MISVRRGITITSLKIEKISISNKEKRMAILFNTTQEIHEPAKDPGAFNKIKLLINLYQLSILPGNKFIEISLL